MMNNKQSRFYALKSSRRNQLALLFSIVAMILFVPGIYLSMLNVVTKGTLEAPIAGFSVSIFDTSNSIINTVLSLISQQFYFVAIMIFIFSIVIPVGKVFLLITIMFSKLQERRNRIFNFIKAIGKWSMCDVYVVSIFLAYLSTGTSQPSDQPERTILGVPINVKAYIAMSAQLELGFYCFLGYCLLSLIALQLYENK